MILRLVRVFLYLLTQFLFHELLVSILSVQILTHVHYVTFVCTLSFNCDVVQIAPFVRRHSYSLVRVNLDPPK